jgi:hypothetical protein
MKFIAAITSVLLLVTSCEDNDGETSGMLWKKLGLEGKTVNEIQLHESVLYVAGTTGLYKKHLNDNSEFSLIGFNNKNVDAVEVIDDQVMIASLFDKSGAEAPGLYKTIDGGATWDPIDSDFGGGNPEPVYDLESHPNNKNILFATGYHVVAKSADQGVTWNPIYGDWGQMATGMSVVEINPNDLNEIWAGGQGAIENGVLLRSKNQMDWDIWNDLVENPTVVKEITFTDTNPDNVLTGWEGALLKTTDGGATWQTLIDSEQNRFYFGICVRNGDPDHIYTGGWLKTSDPQPLILYVSDNGGATWREYKVHNETYGGIMDMQIRSENGRDLLYVGLDKGGVYEVEVTF